MKNWSDAKKTKALVIVWLVSCVISEFSSRIFTIVLENMGAWPLEILGSYHLFSIGLLILYFYPLLFAIRHYAKKAELKAYSTLALLLILYYTFWLLVNVVVIIVTLLR